MGGIGWHWHWVGLALDSIGKGDAKVASVSRQTSQGHFTVFAIVFLFVCSCVSKGDAVVAAMSRQAIQCHSRATLATRCKACSLFEKKGLRPL